MERERCGDNNNVAVSEDRGGEEAEIWDERSGRCPGSPVLISPLLLGPEIGFPRPPQSSSYNQTGPQARGVSTPPILCHKDTDQATYFLPFAVSLWHKGAYKRSFLCMEATYLFCQKEPARSRLVLSSLWQKRAGVATLWSSRPMRAKPCLSSTNESGPGCHRLQPGLVCPGGRVRTKTASQKMIENISSYFLSSTFLLLRCVGLLLVLWPAS